jgi:tRNA 2-thiouridine synthesizing protein A
MSESVEGDGPDSSVELDVTGLLCPLPVLKIRKRMTNMASGDVLSVRASDPATRIDIPHFCAETGHRLLSQSEAGGIFSYAIRHR